MYHCVGFEYAEKYYVQAVPADWVKKKNVLLWPPTGEKTRQLINAHSKPKSNWRKLSYDKVFAKNLGMVVI